MNKNSVRKFLGRSAFALTATALTLTGTQAQDTAPSTTLVNNTNPPPATDQATRMEAFTVTGSYLPVSAAATASPIVTIESSAIGASGATDPIRLLRQLTPFFAGSGNVGTEANNAAGGESNVSLRNLPTLVLINGQRIVSSPFSQGTAVDLNSIPVAMIDKIDILKDGASTVYGTDAIGGVVNVILKKDYNGFEAGAKWGQTANGDYRTKDVYAIGGASGAGFYLTVGAEHFENNTLKTTSRSIATLTPAQENALGFNVTSSVYSGSYPGRVGSDVLAGSTLIAAGGAGFNASVVSPGIKTSPNQAGVTLAQLQAAGIYLPISKTAAGLAVGGSALALNTTLFGNPLMVPTRRNQFVSNGEKELFGKNLVVYSDFLYSDTINSGSTLAPAPIAGVGPAGANTLAIPANNPYNVFSVPFPGPLSARDRLIELGPRTSNIDTNTFRIVAGLKGVINEDYGWDVSYQYSHATMLDRTLGGGNGANMNQAMIPLLNASGGYTYNAAGKPLSVLQDSSGNYLPVYNYFALPGFNDPATLAAIRTTLFDSGSTGLHEFRAIFRGTPFELPGGKLSFDVGFEERSESIQSSVDGLYSNGLALGFNTASTFDGGSRSSKALFAEVDVPLVDPKMALPGIHVLDVQLAERYEKIKPGGNANSPKVEVRYLPIDDQLAFRATAARGFIAPSIFSLFGPSQGNSPTFSVLQGNPALTTGGPGGSYNYTTIIQGTATQLSNPNLQASHSNSFTAGVVYSPKQIKGLSFSADYYKISQDKVGGLDYTGIVADLNAKGSASVYAPGYLFADNEKLLTTAKNQVNALNFGQISVANNPTGTQWTNGLDLAVDYILPTASLGKFGVGSSANILFNYYASENATAPYLQYARNFTDGTNGLGQTNGLLPGYIIKAYASNSYGPLTTSLFFNFVPRTTASGSLFGDYNPADANTNGDTISGRPTTIPSYFTMDVSFSYTLPSFGHNWARNATLTVGANNVWNKKPPYVPVDGNPPGENNTVESTYDIIGRFYFVELSKKF